jgi:transcriptional regulator with XRE-family HTH domain
VRNTDWDYEAFKTYVVTAAANLPGVQSQADIARAIGVGASLLSKWFRGDEKPSLDSLEKIERLPGAKLDDLLKLTGRRSSDGQPTVPPVAMRPVHALARELDAMLDEGSPIALADKEVLVTLVDRVVDPYRRTMRRRRPA